MNTTVRNIILGILGFIVFLLLSAVILAYVLEDKIKQKIVASINEQVTVPVQVDGGIHLSLIQHFPYASLVFKNVKIDDKLQKGKKLINVKEFSLLCNIYSLFSNKVELSKIVIRDGEMNMYRDENGKLNLDIIKPTKDTAQGNVALQLKRAEIKNVHFTYTDVGPATKIDADVKHLELKGNFNSKEFDLATDLSAHIKNIESNHQEWVTNRNVKAEVLLLVNNVTHKYTFKKGKIDLEGSEFNINGFFATSKAGTQLDFTLLNEGKDIQKLVALFPERIRASFANTEGSGEYNIAASVKGLVNSANLPQVQVNATLKNSELKLGKYDKLLKEVNATAIYQLLPSGEDKIVISNFNCTLNNKPFAFNLTLTNLKEPAFDFSAKGELHLAELSSLIPDSVVKEMGGVITFNNFHLKGRKSDFTDVQNSSLTGSGEFKLSDVEFQQNGITYGNINGLLKYDNQVIRARGFTINFLGTQANFTGNIQNLIAFAYNLGTNRNANDVVLLVNGALKVQTLNLTALIEAYSKKNRPQAAVRGKIDIREILNMQGNLDIGIRKFLFKKFVFDNISGNLQIAPGVVRVNDVEMATMGGNARLDGKIIFGDDNSLNLTCDVSAVNLDIPQIFAQCENFGQTTLTDKHLKGNITTSVSFNTTWKNFKDLDQNSMSAIVDFTIKNGELIKFEPLKAASKFIKVEELQDIRFSELSNTIKIANKRIDIPQFEIKSTALNLVFGGYHHFDNTVDYHMKINLHKLLAQKFSRKRTDIEYMEDDPYEGLNIYLSMTGDLANPKITYDKTSARKKMQSDFKAEKENLKNLFKNTPKTVDENEKKREDKYFNIQNEPQFMDFDSTDK